MPGEAAEGCRRLDPPWPGREPASASAAPGRWRAGAPQKKNARLRTRVSAPAGLGLGREMERWREAFDEEESSGGRESGVERAGEGRERGCSGRRSTKRPRRRQLLLQRGSRHALELTWKQGHRPPSRPGSRVKTCNSPRSSAECWLWLWGKPICLLSPGQTGEGGQQGVPCPHAGGFPLTPTAFDPAPAAPCCAAAARAFSSSGALASSLTVDKSEHLLKAKADG